LHIFGIVKESSAFCINGYISSVIVIHSDNSIVGLIDVRVANGGRTSAKRGRLRGIEFTVAVAVKGESLLPSLRAANRFGGRFYLRILNCLIGILRN
jgi:hypothetical protein